MRQILLAATALTAALTAFGAARTEAEGPRLGFPLACEIGKTCEIQHYVDRDPGPGALDYRCGHRTYDKHDGIDFRILDMAAQRAGVEVLAAAAGRVVAVRDGVADISIRAPGAPSIVGRMCGNRVAINSGDHWLVDYCHLANGSLKVKVGDVVAAGQPLARVGLSGDTEFPHLHMSVRHNDLVVDPFASSTASGCAAGRGSLWTASAADRMPYKHGAALNWGFATEIVGNAAIEARGVAAPTAAAPAIVAYARLIGLELGDVIEITLSGPDGKTLATAALPPLDHDKDQIPAEVGRKRPPQGWARGVYGGVVTVRRAGAVAITQRWQMTL
ncbi:M23 family metallopeptidase [Phenylobacterium sp.]|uniref:M23 family metallopeptidase n=1 Tax=Phenylobacterium sp. TaxID=1871053 RepID=UPI00374D5E01